MIARAWTDWLFDACQPAPARRALDPDGEEAEDDEDHQPGDQYLTEVSGRPRTEPRKWTGMGLWGLSIVTASAVDGGGRRSGRKFGARQEDCTEIATRAHGGFLWLDVAARQSSRYPGGYIENTTIPRGVYINPRRGRFP